MSVQVKEVKILCAWCDREMGTEEGAGDVRYSVCRKCLAKFNIFPENRDKDTTPAGSRKDPENG